MLFDRIKLEELEKRILAPYAVKNSESLGRKYSETDDFLRLAFQRDRDRIIHSHAFRRLKAKTQVFVAHYGDHYRNRLTHTLEVAHLSRDIARNLNVNEDLCETIALAHDLGHTPFGHAGEETLNEIMQGYGESFEHNEQSKRIVTLLEKGYQDFLGLNLSYEVLDGLAKHQTIYDQQGIKIHDNLSIEGQIVNYADEIAYQTHDIEDGLRSGIINKSELLDLAIIKDLNIAEHNPVNSLINALIKIMVHDLSIYSARQITILNIKSLKDVYQQKSKIISFSPQIALQNQELREFLMQKFYLAPAVQKQSKRGQMIIKFLFNSYLKNLPKHINPDELNDQKELVIAIKDYIAGMTDAYAETQFYS